MDSLFEVFLPESDVTTYFGWIRTCLWSCPFSNFPVDCSTSIYSQFAACSKPPSRDNHR